jgi:hypothetical protein
LKTAAGICEKDCQGGEAEKNEAPMHVSV